MSLQKILGFSLLSSCLLTAGLGSIPSPYAQEIGRWVGETSEGFQFVFTITPERTIQRIQVGYTKHVTAPNPTGGSRWIFHVPPTSTTVTESNPTGGSRWIVQVQPTVGGPRFLGWT